MRALGFIVKLSWIVDDCLEAILEKAWSYKHGLWISLCSLTGKSTRIELCSVCHCSVTYHNHVRGVDNLYPKLGPGCVSFLLMEVCCSWIIQLCTLTNE